MSNQATLRAAVACIFLFAPTATGTPDINSNCPLPRWDHATMDTLARREGYKINDTDITAVPWVRRTYCQILLLMLTELQGHFTTTLRRA